MRMKMMMKVMMKIKMKTDDDVNVNLGAFVCKAMLQPHL